MDRFDIAWKAYEECCEHIFQSWLAGELANTPLWSSAQISYCPEPYLTFRPGKPAVIFLSHNPGDGEPFQLRKAIDTDSSPIKSVESYAANSAFLASAYEIGIVDIEDSARQRAKSFVQFGSALKFAGIREVELCPVHSKNRPPAKFLFGDGLIGPALGGYRERVNEVVHSAPFVIAVTGGPMVRSGPTINNWAKQLQMDLNTAHAIELSQGKSPPSVGAFATRDGERIRLLTCRWGFNGLPSATNCSKLREHLLSIN